MATNTTPAAATPSTPAPASDAPQTVQQQQDAFDSAFAEAVALPDTSVATPAAEAVTPPAPVVPATPAAASTETPAPVTDPAETPAPVTEPAADSPEARIAALEAENARLKAKPAEPDPVPAAPKSTDTAPAADQPAQPQWYQPSEQESALLAQYSKEWPDHAEAVAIIAKQSMHNVIQYMFAKVAETYNPAIKRFEEVASDLQEALTLGALRGEHSDYDEVYDKLAPWVETLPGPFKIGAQQVMKEGTPQQVSELVAAYKAQHSTAAAAPAAPATPAAPAAPRTTELSATAKKAAVALTVVDSKRTTPIAPADANDFDGAWAEALAVSAK